MTSKYTVDILMSAKCIFELRIWKFSIQNVQLLNAQYITISHANVDHTVNYKNASTCSLLLLLEHLLCQGGDQMTYGNTEAST